ncbi:hypothetical protein BC938DRAFT_477611 [Jimgerdemannia flammicorona]|uniref:Uncharacterized protein n=1 Tax=Jimgerdemannia flammicorona TaxID=994334 RepID=A0A433QP31_9FUNG|nr:hypothetical protein BC938DRAFT_477611 [Jimgerdemannia flammicorona]
MHRPLRKTSLLLLLAVILVLATVSSAIIPEARFAARAVLLNQAIWIYGGVTDTHDKPQNLLWRLDVSVGWDTSNTPYINYTDGRAPAPVTEWGTLFPSADQSAFYSLDVYGPGQTFTLGKYDIANRAWLMFPTTGVTIPNAAGNRAIRSKRCRPPHSALFSHSESEMPISTLVALSHSTTRATPGSGAATSPKRIIANVDVYQFDHKLQLWNSSSIATREFHTANLLP